MMRTSLSRAAATALLAAAAATAAATTAAAAEPPAETDSQVPWYERARQRVETTWEEGSPVAYLPLHTTHLRFAYSREKIDSYNEDPWGIGFGKGMHDADGDWHGLYFIGFRDSNSKPQYLAGYGYRTYWSLLGELKIGLGYNAFLTARSDIGHYIPIPLVLPAASLQYKKFALDTLYIPGRRNIGNVLFFYGRIGF